MRLRWKLLMGVLVTLGLCLFIKFHKPYVPLTVADSLPPGDHEQITVDPVHHSLILKRKGQPPIVTVLPDRQTVIDVKTDGSIKVTAPQFGFETKPFVGLGFGQGFRGYAGADLMYWKKADLGLGAITPRLFNNPDFIDWRGGAFVSYNVYDNLRLTGGYDTSKTVHLLLSVRI